jgi:hypothetical protein
MERVRRVMENRDGSAGRRDQSSRTSGSVREAIGTATIASGRLPSKRAAALTAQALRVIAEARYGAAPARCRAHSGSPRAAALRF